MKVSIEQQNGLMKQNIRLMRRVFYWSPHINSQVATCKAVINSAYSLKRYSKIYEPYIINCFGEWDFFKKELDEKKINVINLFNIKINLPINGFLKSRIFYIIFSFLAILPLCRLIKKYRPEYFILHLIVIPGLISSLLFRDKTKFILRISGYPKLNFFRRTLWNLCSKNLSTIFSPTLNTIQLLQNNKVFKNKTLQFLEDPIIEISKINKQKNVDLVNFKKNSYIVSIGRLTKQKNFDFLINSFRLLSKKKNLKLLIVGHGELKKTLDKKINDLGLKNRVILTGYKENIFNYISNSKLFVLSSDWEDPGFVIIEAAACGKIVLCSKVQSGPLEFIGEDETCGFMYKKNDFDDFSKKINFVLDNLSSQSVKLKIYNAKKKAGNYTLFKHHQKLSNYLNYLN